MKLLPTALAALLLLSISANAAAEPPRQYRPNQDGFTPPHILAVVQMHNGGTRCSGTVISRGREHALILSARHCVAGNIGNSCRWRNCDGSEFAAELIAVDQWENSDLCLFRAASKDVLARSWVPTEKPEFVVRYEACGYTGGGGLKWKKVAPYQYSGVRPKYRFDVSEGAFAGGDSGGAVFADGALISVISASEPRFFGGVERKFNKHIYGVTHQAITEFLSAAVGTPEESQQAGCGRWGCRPRNKIGQGDNDGKRFTPEPNIEIKPDPDELFPPGEGDVPDHLLTQIAEQVEALTASQAAFQQSVDERLTQLEQAGDGESHDVTDEVTQAPAAADETGEPAQPAQAGFLLLLLVVGVVGGVIYFSRR